MIFAVKVVCINRNLQFMPGLVMAVLVFIDCGYCSSNALMVSRTIVFLADSFLFTSADTFAVGCIVQPQNTPKKQTAEYLCL